MNHFSSKLKTPSEDRISSMDRGGIEPLYPNGNCEFLARGGPFDSIRYKFVLSDPAKARPRPKPFMHALYQTNILCQVPQKIYLFS